MATGHRDGASPPVIDGLALLVAAVVIVLAAASSNDAVGDQTSRSLDGWAVALLAGAIAAAVAARRWPAPGAVVALGLSFVWYGVGYTSGIINVTTLTAFYFLGASALRLTKLAVTIGSVAAVLVNILLLAEGPWSEALRAAGYVLVAVLVGELMRARQLLVEHHARRADEAEAEARRRITEERLAIARDIHDVLAHTVSAMIVQAGVASERIDTDPRGAHSAVESIREAGRDALAEVRATVAVLRSQSDIAHPTPAPTLTELDGLAATGRERGLRVDVDTELSGRELPELVELTAYRVVQEGLTNVVRHSSADSVQLVVREVGATLLVEVRDDGARTARGEPAIGFGLRGMAERVESVGGELWHGYEESGGWVVRATIPLPTPAR